jgi:hypothetical protein
LGGVVERKKRESRELRKKDEWVSLRDDIFISPVWRVLVIFLKETLGYRNAFQKAITHTATYSCWEHVERRGAQEEGNKLFTVLL